MVKCTVAILLGTVNFLEGASIMNCIIPWGEGVTVRSNTPSAVSYSVYCQAVLQLTVTKKMATMHFTTMLCEPTKANIIDTKKAIYLWGVHSCTDNIVCVVGLEIL